MATSHLFEDFSDLPKKPIVPTSLDVEEVEDQKLQAFENGYQAGWEDAVKAQVDTGGHVSAGLAASLQDASFEYHEVRNTLTSAVQTIMQELMTTLLPKIAQHSLGAHIREQVLQMTQGALDRSIEVVVAPDAEETVRSLFVDDVEQPFDLVTDPLLAPTQALLRLGADEREIDLQRLVAGIGDTVTAFFETEKPEATHG
jgi:flagellar assembly protein FliH